MPKLMKNTVFATILAVGIALLAGCSGSTASQRGTVLEAAPAVTPQAGEVQSNTGGAVTIDLDLLNKSGTVLTFQVAMNTHSVNLDGYDLSKLAVLRDDTGKEYKSTAWQSAPGGHHRNGTLIFQMPNAVKQGSARYIEVIIRDVAGIEERVFKWEL
jgi:hypothetical protein